MDGLEELLGKIRAEGSGCLPDFRLFITTEPHPKFPIGLLQLAVNIIVNKLIDVDSKSTADLRDGAKEGLRAARVCAQRSTRQPRGAKTPCQKNADP